MVTYHKSLQASTSCICHEDTRALLKAEGLQASLQGGAVVLLTIHIEPNLLMLDRQRKAVPLLCHIRHFKGSHFHCVCKPWLAVIEYNPLGLILHGRQGQAQVDDPLGGICDGEQNPSSRVGWLDGDNNGKVHEEGLRYKVLGQSTYISIRPKIVSRETLVSSDERHRWRKRNTN